MKSAHHIFSHHLASTKIPVIMAQYVNEQILVISVLEDRMIISRL